MQQTIWNSRYLYIVVTYNGSTWIKTFVDESVGIPHINFLVVDNASTDTTVELLAQDYPEIKVIKSDRNLGFGQANNLGLSYALEQDYEFVVLLNQDASLSKNALAEILAAHKSESAKGIMTPLHFFEEGKLDVGFEGYLGNNGPLENLPDHPFEVPFINAAIWVFSTNLLRSIGGFDPDFYHYGEDQDYVNRARYHGFSVTVVPDAKGFHRRHQVVGMELSKIPLQVKNRGYYLAKNINISLVKGYALWHRTFLPRFYEYGVKTHKVPFLRWLKIWTEVNRMFFQSIFKRPALKRKGTMFLPVNKS